MKLKIMTMSFAAPPNTPTHAARRMSLAFLFRSLSAIIPNKMEATLRLTSKRNVSCPLYRIQPSAHEKQAQAIEAQARAPPILFL